jgi:hypothetical protein
MINKRKLVNGSLLFCMLLTMVFPYTGFHVHKIAGLLFLLLFFVHQGFNYRWYKSLFRGKYNKARVLLTVVDAALILSVVVLALTIPFFLNRSLAASVGIGHGTLTAAHIMSGCLVFVLMGVHVGLHGNAILYRLKKFGRTFNVMFRAAAAVLALIGGYVFLQSPFLSYMLGQSHFLEIDRTAPVLLYLADILLIWVFFAVLTVAVNQQLTKRRSK